MRYLSQLHGELLVLGLQLFLLCLLLLVEVLQLRLALWDGVRLVVGQRLKARVRAARFAQLVVQVAHLAAQLAVQMRVAAHEHGQLLLQLAGALRLR
jgi:hypothetical protein